MAEDILIDTPGLWDYVPEFLYPLVHKNVSLSFMRDLLDPLKTMKGHPRAHIMARTLHLSANDVGHDVVGEAFRRSGLDWSRDFLDGEEEGEFLSAKRLEWTVTEVPLSPRPLEAKDLLARLTEALSDNKRDNEEFYSFIEEGVPHSLLTSTNFVDALVQAVIINAFGMQYVTLN